MKYKIVVLFKDTFEFEAPFFNCEDDKFSTLENYIFDSLEECKRVANLLEEKGFICTIKQF